MFHKNNARRFLYRWIVLASALFVTVIAYGGTYSFGVFFKPIQDEFTWTSAQTSAVFSLYMFFYCAFGMLAGYSVDRLGPKITVACGGLLVGAGFVLAAHTRQLWHIYLSYGVLTGAGMSAFYGPLLTTVSLWFQYRRGLALGVVTSGIGIGTLIAPPLFDELISGFGWRWSYIMAGSFISGSIVTLSLVLRRNPASIPVVAMEEARHYRTTPQNALVCEQGREFSADPGKGMFWIVSVVYLLVGFGFQMMLVHIVPSMQEKYAFSRGGAACILSTIGGVSIVGRLVMGAASDYIGRKTALAICTSLEGLSIVLMLLPAQTGILYVSAALFGFGYGGHTPQLPALIGEIFGLSRMGTIIGRQLIFYGIGGAIGPFLAGYLLDRSGSYRGAFYLAATAMFFVTILSLNLTVPNRAKVTFDGDSDHE